MTTKNDVDGSKDDLAGGPVADLENAPLPTKQTLRARKGLIRQFFRFMAFNLTIMSMVLKGHSAK